MTQSAGRYPILVDPALLFLRHRDPLAVATTVYYHGVVIALDSQGRAAKATGAAGLKIVGFYDGETFTAVATDRVSISNGVIPMVNSSTDPVTIADLKNVVYLESDDTIARTSAGGTLSPCGILELFEDSTPKVQIGGLPSAILSPSEGSLLIHAPVADQTAMQAVPANERADGMLVVDLTTNLVWQFDSGSAAGASAWVRVPAAGTGRWLRTNASLTDLASVASGYGASLIGVEDAAGHTANTTVETIIAEVLMHLRSVQTAIPFPLLGWREVTSGGDVGNIVAIGGVLASDTTPILRADAAESLEISWAAGNSDIVGLQVPLPADFDGSQDATVDLWVYTDNGGGGGIDPATFTVETSFDGGALVSDAATDGTPAVTIHKITATIAAADIPNAARFLTMYLTPAAHAADPVQLVNASLNYKPKLLTS